MDKKSKFITTREAAELLNVSLRTVQLWVESGVIQAWKTAGGHRRIVRSCIDDLLQQRQQSLSQYEEHLAHTVLVIGDNEATLNIYTQQASKWDLPAKLVTADNALQGLILIGKHVPDLVIIDASIGDIDAVQIACSIKASSVCQSIQIIALSSMREGDSGGKNELPEGVTFLTKPIDFSVLEEVIMNKLEN